MSRVPTESPSRPSPTIKPESANRLTLGETVYGLADDRPYLPAAAETTDGERTAGVDWFTFTFESDVPKLAFFALDFVDRDVPPDLRVYRQENGQVVEYTRGIDPQSLQRERPPRMGANKFTTRVLTQRNATSSGSTPASPSINSGPSCLTCRRT